MAARGGSGRGVVSIVRGAGEGIRKQGPRLVDAAHALHGLHGPVMQVGVMALREPAMRACDLQRRGPSGNTEYCVRVVDSSSMHRARFYERSRFADETARRSSSG